MKRRALLAALLLPMFPAAALPGAAAEWQVVNDGVMGGVSSAQVAASADGALRFSGVVRLDYNGGFASARRAATLPADATGLAITARGDGNRYRLTLFTRDARTGARQPFMYYAVFGTGVPPQPKPTPPVGGGVPTRPQHRCGDSRARLRG
ncbi:MAG: CIA30 family protein, partial [Betaproteobacteria bacterium]